MSGQQPIPLHLHHGVVVEGLRGDGGKVLLVEPPEIGLHLALLVGPHEAAMLVDGADQGVEVVPAGADVHDHPVVVGGGALAGHTHVGHLQLVQQGSGQGVHGEAIPSTVLVAPHGLLAPILFVGGPGIVDPAPHVVEDGLQLLGGDHIRRYDIGQDGLGHLAYLLVGDGGLHQSIGAALGGGVPTPVRGGVGDGVLALSGQEYAALHGHIHPPVHVVLGVRFRKIGDGFIHIAGAVHHPVEDRGRIVHGQRQGEGGSGFVPGGIHGLDGKGLGLVAVLIGGLDEGQGHACRIRNVHQLLGRICVSGVEGLLLKGQDGGDGVHHGHQGDLDAVRQPDSNGIISQGVCHKPFRLSLRTIDVRAGEQAVLRLHGHTPQGGVEDLGGHVGPVAAGVRHPDQDVLDLPAVRIRGLEKGILEGRFIGRVRQKGFRRGGLPGRQDQKLARSGRGHRVLDRQDGGEDALVFRALDPQDVLPRGPHHMVGDRVQQLPVKALGQKEVHGGDGRAGLHGDPVHRRADQGGGLYLVHVAAAVLQLDDDGLFPGGGEVVVLGEAHAHPVRILQIGDELIRRGLVSRGEVHRHGHGRGGHGILNDQPAGHYPEPGDHLHHMPTQGGAAFVGQEEGVILLAEGGHRGHVLPVFAVDHGGDAVISPQQQHPQGQQKAQEAQQDRPASLLGGRGFLLIRLASAYFHITIIARSGLTGYPIGNSSQKCNGLSEKRDDQRRPDPLMFSRAALHRHDHGPKKGLGPLLTQGLGEGGGGGVPLPDHPLLEGFETRHVLWLHGGGRRLLGVGLQGVQGHLVKAGLLPGLDEGARHALLHIPGGLFGVVGYVPVGGAGGQEHILVGAIGGAVVVFYVAEVLLAHVHGVDEQEGHVLPGAGRHHHGQEVHEPQHGPGLQHAQIAEALHRILFQVEPHHQAPHGPILFGRDLLHSELFLQNGHRIQADHLLVFP